MPTLEDAMACETPSYRLPSNRRRVAHLQCLHDAQASEIRLYGIAIPKRIDRDMAVNEPTVSNKPAE